MTKCILLSVDISRERQYRRRPMNLLSTIPKTVFSSIVSTIDTVCDVGDYYQALAAQVVTIITSEGNDSSLRSWQGDTD